MSKFFVACELVNPRRPLESWDTFETDTFAAALRVYDLLRDALKSTDARTYCRIEMTTQPEGATCEYPVLTCYATGSEIRHPRYWQMMEAVARTA